MNVISLLVYVKFGKEIWKLCIFGVSTILRWSTSGMELVYLKPETYVHICMYVHPTIMCLMSVLVCLLFIHIQTPKRICMKFDTYRRLV